MPIYLKQSTASQEVTIGPFLDNSDGITPLTSLTIANTDVKVWKTGATTFSNKNSGGGTHISNGVYYVVLDATDTNTLGSLELWIFMAGALIERKECVVLSAMVYDSLVGGGDTLQVDVTQFNGTNGTFSSGRPEVNTTHAAGTAWASGAITANSFAQGAADKVWSTTTRTLSAGTNIQLPSNGLANVTAWTVAITGNITGNLSGSIGSVAANGLSATSIASNALTSAKFDASAITAIQSGLGTSANQTAIKTVTDNLATMYENVGGYRWTDHAVSNVEGGSGGGGSCDPAEIAEAVWSSSLTGDLGTFTAEQYLTMVALIDTNVSDMSGWISNLIESAGGGNYRFTELALSEAISATAVTAITTGVLNTADSVESGYTLAGILRVIGATQAGLLDGMLTNTPVFYALSNDSKPRVSAAVTADGRSSVSIDASY